MWPSNHPHVTAPGQNHLFKCFTKLHFRSKSRHGLPCCVPVVSTALCPPPWRVMCMGQAPTSSHRGHIGQSARWCKRSRTPWPGASRPSSPATQSCQLVRGQKSKHEPAWSKPTVTALLSLQSSFMDVPLDFVSPEAVRQKARVVVSASTPPLQMLQHRRFSSLLPLKNHLRRSSHKRSESR